jgi:hypothetical protein
VSSQVSQAAAKNWKVPAALATSARVSLIGLPLSSRCSCASSSPRSRMPLAMRCSMPARSWRLSSPRPAAGAPVRRPAPLRRRRRGGRMQRGHGAAVGRVFGAVQRPAGVAPAAGHQGLDLLAHGRGLVSWLRWWSGRRGCAGTAAPTTPSAPRSWGCRQRLATHRQVHLAERAAHVDLVHVVAHVGSAISAPGWRPAPGRPAIVAATLAFFGYRRAASRAVACRMTVGSVKAVQVDRVAARRACRASPGVACARCRSHPSRPASRAAAIASTPPMAPDSRCSCVPPRRAASPSCSTSPGSTARPPTTPRIRRPA